MELAEDREFGHKFETSEVFWEEVDEIMEALQPLYDATIAMQAFGFGLADFNIRWLRICKSLKRIHAPMTNLPNLLLERLKAHEPAVFNTPNMLAAMYLDPRVKYKLSSTQKECAILHLKNLHMRMKQLTEKPALNASEMNTTLDELKEEFEAIHGRRERVSGDILTALSNYDLVGHVDYKADLMDLATTQGGIFIDVPLGKCSTFRSRWSMR